MGGGVIVAQVKVEYDRSLLGNFLAERLLLGHVSLGLFRISNCISTVNNIEFESFNAIFQTFFIDIYRKDVLSENK